MDNQLSSLKERAMELIHSRYILEQKRFKGKTLSYHYYYYYCLTRISLVPYLSLHISIDSHIMDNNYKTQYKDSSVIHSIFDRKYCCLGQYNSKLTKDYSNQWIVLLSNSASQAVLTI